MAHLGGLVLDGAKVRVAAYTLSCGLEAGVSTYIRSIDGTLREREERVRDVLSAIRAGESSPYLFRADQREFGKFPFAVFGYWCSAELREAFVDFPRLEGDWAHVRQGLATADDFRFLRLKWEVTPSDVGRDGWVPFAKGGEYSPFNDDVHLVLNWGRGRGALAAFHGSVIRNPDEYWKPGLTYPRRVKRFAPRVMPRGCAFGDKGPAIVDSDVAMGAGRTPELSTDRLLLELRYWCGRDGGSIQRIRGRAGATVAHSTRRHER